MNKEPIKFLIWVYFWLLIFEGALRRWVFKGSSDFLLVIRDPIAILIIVLGFQLLFKERFRFFVLSNFLIGILACFLAMAFGHQDWLVTAYGARLHFLHLPLIFIIPQVLTENDFWKFAKCTLFLAIPMTVLLVAQFIYPSDHWVNIGYGGIAKVETSAFGNVFGKGRPPGTFSMITGTIAFYSLVWCFFSSFIANKKKKLPFWGWLLPFCILIALAFSVSRSLIFRFSIGVIIFILASSYVKKAKSFLVFLFFFITIFFGVFFLLSKNNLFNDAVLVTQYRWESANEGESRSDSGLNFLGAISHRLFLDSILIALKNGKLHGYGLGIFSNVARFRTNDSLTNTFNQLDVDNAIDGAESPILFLFLEYGTILGILYFLWRICLFYKIGVLCFNMLLKEKNCVPISFFGWSSIPLLSGFLYAPTVQGFLVFSLGLTLCALKQDEDVK